MDTVLDVFLATKVELSSPSQLVKYKVCAQNETEKEPEWKDLWSKELCK